MMALNRRTPLGRGPGPKRRTPLNGNSELRRSGRLNPMSKKRRAEIPARAEIRSRVFERDNGCVLAGVPEAGPCFGHMTPHHIHKAGQGGAYTEENLVTLCAHHNDRIEADAEFAALAHRLGLTYRRGDQTP